MEGDAGMTDGMYRIGIVGAASLVGKELADELQESLLATSDFILLDDEEVTGSLASVGDEAAFVQRIEPGSFDRMDFVFFAGNTKHTTAHWLEARRTGASVVDLTYALEGETDVLVRAPWLTEARKSGGRAAPDLQTRAVVAAHPAAVMLGLVAARLSAAMTVKTFAATLMEPASEHGREAMDELHQQTVSLLSFQNLPKEQYDAQVTFNLLPVLGEAAKMKLAEVDARILRHYVAIAEGRLPALELQVIQAPVFHGYCASVLVETAEPVMLERVELALAGEHVDLGAGESDPPSNLSAAGQEDVMVQVRAASKMGLAGTRFWLWLAIDNLKFRALNGIACANELRRLRPTGKVQ
jgi:aspartate-semialdehyde dehydrogenase